VAVESASFALREAVNRPSTPGMAKTPFPLDRSVDLGCRDRHCAQPARSVAPNRQL